jgi:hypothetical protein
MKKKLTVNIILEKTKPFFEKRPDYTGRFPIHFGKKIKEDGKTVVWSTLRPANVKADVRITTIVFDINERYSHADALTNGGIGIYAVTRRSNLDPHSPELAIRVLAGKLLKALETYQNGENLRKKGNRFASIVPERSMQ